MRLGSLFGQKTDAIPIRAEMMHALVSGVDADSSLMTVVKEAFDDVAAVLFGLDGAPVFEHSLKGVETVSIFCIDELAPPIFRGL